MQNIISLADTYAKNKSRGELREQKIIRDAVLYGYALKDADPGSSELQAQPIPEHVEIPGQAGKPYIIASEQPVLQGAPTVAGGVETPQATDAPPKQMKWDVPADTTLPNSGEGIDKPSAIQSTEPGQQNADFPLYSEGEKPVEQAGNQPEGPVVEGVTAGGVPITKDTQEEAIKDVEEKRDAPLTEKGSE